MVLKEKQYMSREDATNTNIDEKMVVANIIYLSFAYLNKALRCNKASLNIQNGSTYKSNFEILKPQ